MRPVAAVLGRHRVAWPAAAVAGSNGLMGKVCALS